MKKDNKGRERIDKSRYKRSRLDVYKGEESIAIGRFY